MTISHSTSDCPLSTIGDDTMDDGEMSNDIIRGCAIDDSMRAIVAALDADDLNTAINLGLLQYVSIAERQDIDATAACTECTRRDRTATAARDERLCALAARERYRHREARLRERARRRAEKRGSVSVTTEELATATKPASLPASAAAALARAKAKAASKRGGDA
jgi:hypothetical protein